MRRTTTMIQEEITRLQNSVKNPNRFISDIEKTMIYKQITELTQSYTFALWQEQVYEKSLRDTINEVLMSKDTLFSTLNITYGEKS